MKSIWGDFINTQLFLSQLREKCAQEQSYVPIVKPATMALLEMLIKMQNAKKILEIGTGVGYSAIAMANAAGVGCRINTIERYSLHADLARANICDSGFDKMIRVIEGDAAEVLPCLTGEFDLIFQDGAKGQYSQFLPDVLRLTKKGGIIVSDDVLYKGMVTGECKLQRRKITIIKRLRRYLKDLQNINNSATYVLPMEDGVAVTIKDLQI